MKPTTRNSVLITFFTALRVLVGWHFLFEGISKLATPHWTSASYLMESKWLFSGFFHWLIANPGLLKIVDFMNIWGLIFIGLALFLGIFIRISSLSGVALLSLYYIANPPFVISSLASSSHYYFINTNVIEAAVLVLFAIVSKDYFWGFDRLFVDWMERRKEKKFPDNINHEVSESMQRGRRNMIKNLVALPILGGAFFGMAKQVGWLSFEEKNLSKTDANSGATSLVGKRKDLSELKGKVPMGKIKNVEMSRLIPGGNLVSGFAHSRDLIYVSALIKNYFTDEKVIETLWLYEACGINTTVMRCDEQTIRILKKFWSRGGKIQWLAQTYPKENDLSNVQLAIDNGAIGAFVMGNIADKYVFNNQMDFIKNPVDLIKSHGLIAGVGGHSIKVPMACVEHGIEVDFFMKTFHHDKYWSAQPKENRDEFFSLKGDNNLDHNQSHDNLWCASATDTADFFKKCDIPWIAYKVLAAGAIQPEDGIKFAFENGADFTCVGMFDFQVIDNANIVYSTLNSDLKRERKWFG
ncbi:MAG: hypothetical protein PF489_12670 [Salinivirgaceae bacterium]|jgi:uncharacterized membrane protein YphA (DoxX/SURF4 family)|nr:hypothetical protein [Salinivirgaceae bacterium]